MNLTWKKRRLELKRPWTLSRGTSAYKEYWFVELEEDGVIGYGEAAHNVRYGESLELVEEFFLNGGEGSGPAAARAALDLARHDLSGKKQGITVAESLGIERCELVPTSYSIGIDSVSAVKSKVAEAGEFHVLKIKLGGGNDEEVMRAVREETDQLVRVDANEGWETKEVALEKIEWLAGLDVEFVEQPLPSGRFEEMAWLKERSPLPLIADEDVCGLEQVDGLVGAYHGINVKLMKAGGISAGHEVVVRARSLGLGVMLGCMIESSLGIAAALQLAPLADWLDLDGHLLLKNDPFVGVECESGCLLMPEGAGLGVSLKFD